MLFSSTLFLFLFLPICLLASFVLPNIRLKNFFLLLASLFFYAWGEGELVFLMLFTILLNYVFGIAISKSEPPSIKKIYLTLSIISNLSILGYYKYFNFLIENLNSILIGLGETKITAETVTLPIGISFFIFQSISYVIDVYRNDAKVQKDPLNLALYISLFPQLIAGPIVRYHDVFLQLEKRNTDTNKIALGIKRFIIGLGKKVLIANTCGRVADQIFELSENDLSGSLAWLGIVCYTIQIFFDFSGYSDMAIGLGKMFGFDFLENFNYPFIARSIKNFWQRWHISLSTWIRDYLYIPLGGNKKSNSRTYLNLIIVFFLTGLWHGASWNFIVWGLFHGIFLLIERLFLEKLLSRLPKFVSHFYTLFVVIIAFVFFRTSDINSALVYIQKMFSFTQQQNDFYPFLLFFDFELIITLIVAIIVSIPTLEFIKQRMPFFNRSYHILTYTNYIGLFSIFILSIIYIASGTHNPFIYFRF